jgi:hypothetical protein
MFKSANNFALFHGGSPRRRKEGEVIPQAQISKQKTKKIQLKLSRKAKATDNTTH